MFQPKTEESSDGEYTANGRQTNRQNVRGICGLLNDKPLGEVINMSGNGMLMVWHGQLTYKDGHTFDMQLRWQDVDADISATITWTKYVGFRRWLIGMKFKGLTGSDVTTVKKMALAGARFEEIHPRHVPE